MNILGEAPYSASVLAGAFPHEAQTEYRYDRVRELRRLGAKPRPGSTGCIEEKVVQVGSEKDPQGKRGRRPPLD